jgi:hypothetical protein
VRIIKTRLTPNEGTSAMWTDPELDEETIALLLNQARRYRNLASNVREAEVAEELKHLAYLFEAEAARGTGRPVTLH